MDYRLSNLIDLPPLQKLMENFYAISGIGSAIVDTDGTFLAWAGWQDICVKFHRASLQTRRRCRRSDSYIKNRLHEEPYIIYKCLNGLMDCAAPVIVDGYHVGTFIVGQFLLEPPDEEFFLRQARQFDFNEQAYLAALRKVPVITRSKAESVMAFYSQLAQLLTTMGLERLRQLEAADLVIREREERLRLVLEGTNEGFWDWNVKTGELYYSPRWSGMLGYSAEEVEPAMSSWENLLHPEDRLTFQKDLNEHLEGNTSGFEAEFRLKNKSGGWKWVLCRGKVVSRDAQGRPLRMTGSNRDIAEEKQAELLFKTLSSQSPVGVYIVQDGKFQFVNPCFQKLTGYTEKELLGMDPLRIVHPDDRQIARQGAVNMLKGFRQSPYEFRGVTRDGETRWVLETVNSIWYKDKRAVLGSYMDITERKLSEEKLQAAHRQLTDIIEFLPDATFVVDRNRKVIFWNRAIEEMTGVDKDQVLGKGDMAYAVPFYGEERPLLIDLLFMGEEEAQAIAGQYENLENRDATIYAETFIPSMREGEGAYLWVKASPLFDSEGNLIGAIESIRDITESRREKEQLRHLSLHDSLTGLYNRAYFEQEMRRLGSGRHDPVGIIVCDVDGLKLVNDTLGHDTGDTLLVAAARVIKESFREGDMVARIGGDEFAVLMPESDSDAVENARGRIRSGVFRYNSANPELPLSISLGHAVRTGAPMSMNELFKEADNNMYREKLQRGQDARGEAIRALVAALEARDHIADGHAERLIDLMTGLAGSIGMPENKLDELRLLAQFHDIGKVGISESILFKPGLLTPEEQLEVQRHCEIGHRIAMSSPDLVSIADWILKHHEWWDGEGYPLKLRGEEIPLECRLLAIADAYDALTSDRPYREAMSNEDALAEIKKYAGTQFDPALVETLLKIRS